MKNLLLGAVLLLLASGYAVADSITLKGGHTATGTVLQTNRSGNSILLMRDYGTATYYLPIVETVSIEDAGAIAVWSNTNRIPDWRNTGLHLSKRPWALDLKQIPATVIDNGILRHVPYISFRCGEDYEVNIYGDLDQPAGFEIGVYRKLLSDGTAKDNCVEFVEALLSDSADQAVLGKLSREKDNATREGITFEITPPTAEDAYAGWWVSVYDQKRLNLARASDSELKQISVAKTASTTLAEPGWSTNEMKLARPAKTYRTQPQQSPPAVRYNPVPTRASTSYSPPSSGSDRVYVRGYYRKDGTYVQAHTRSAPRR